MRKIILVKVVEVTQRLEPEAIAFSIKLAAESPEALPKRAMKEKEFTLNYPACFAIGDVILANARYEESDQTIDYWLIQPPDHTWRQTEGGWNCIHCDTKVKGSLFIEPCLRCGKEVDANELYCADCETKEAIRC